jgi:hypothetical protein
MGVWGWCGASAQPARDESSAGVRRTRNDPLPSWNAGAVKSAITGFVARVTDKRGADYVPPRERIATFDNDGTLWAEQPIYFQVQFALDRIKELAPQHPEWKETQPFKSVLDGDHAGLEAAGKKGILEIIAATHAGMTTDAFNKIVADWLATARHPRFNRLYTEMVYQPMLELLAYLRGNGFKTFIVSGGGVELLPDGRPVLIKEAKVLFIDDGPGKPEGINHFIGHVPIFAFGNSDGDLEMLQYTAGGPGARFMGLVHHTDAEREWAYDRHSHIGRLDKALDAAKTHGWTVVDMKHDWGSIFPPVPATGTRALR